MGHRSAAVGDDFVGTGVATNKIRKGLCLLARWRPGWPGRDKKPECRDTTEHSVMSMLDLIKATVICGAVAFLIYTFPILGQVVTIGFLGLLWLAYAHKAIVNLRRR